MMRTRWATLLLVVALAGCSRATPEQQIVNDAAEALGGVDRLQAATTLVLRGEGTQYNLGQDVVPGARGQTFTVTGYARAIDLAGGRARTELTRQPNFAFFQGPAPQRQIQGVDGDIAYNVAASGTATRAGGTAASDRRLEILHHPVAAVRAALAGGATLANPRTENGHRMVDVTSNGQKFTLAIDATSRRPTMVSHRAAHANLGDVVITTTFADYQDVSGLQLPATFTTSTDDFVTAEYRLNEQAVDDGAVELAAPDEARATAAPAGPPPVNVTVEPLSPGIWRLAGGSHHSVLVEFADHLTLIEAPQSEARTLAVIASARETVPGKPLTQVVNTHHHFDHTGGIRAAIAEGLTVITHEGNVDFFRDVAARPATIAPDALQNSGRAAIVEGVGAEGRVLTDGAMTVNLSAITTAHSQTMLVAYVPRTRLLVEADAYTPGAAAQMYAAEFLEQLRERNLRIDRIVPLHGQPVPFAQLVKEAGAN